MFLLPNLIIIIILTFAIYAGLDKLNLIMLFIGIIFCSDLFNRILKSITPESKLICKITSLFKEKYSPVAISKYTKISYCLLFLVTWILLMIKIAFLSTGSGLSVGDSFNFRIFNIFTFILVYFYSLFATRTILINNKENTVGNEAQYYKMLQYLAIYQLIFAIYHLSILNLSEELVEVYLAPIHDYSILLFLVYLFCIILERLFDTYRIIKLTIKNTDSYYEVPFFISIIASSNSLKESIIKTIEAISGVNLSNSEMANYIINHIEPVTIIAIIIFWLISSIIIIPPDQEAICYRMGRIVGNQSYKPGIHFKLPWPFEKMELFKPKEIQTLNIGFTPDPKKKNIIWAKSHASENFFLLVGNGVEIIAVDCQVFFKIDDLYKYLTKIQNPKRYIEALTYKLLTANTVSKTFDDIISQNRDTLISDIRSKLQKELDDIDLGVSIVEIVILAIHPPLEVAPAYEDVISAQIDKQMYILQSKTENVHKIHMKKAFAINEQNKAKSYAEETVANAFGEAASFESRFIGYNTDPELEEFRLKLDYLQAMAASKNLYIIDKSFMRDNDRIMLNLQN